MKEDNLLAVWTLSVWTRPSLDTVCVDTSCVDSQNVTYGWMGWTDRQTYGQRDLPPTLQYLLNPSSTYKNFAKRLETLGIKKKLRHPKGSIHRKSLRDTNTVLQAQGVGTAPCPPHPQVPPALKNDR